MKQHYQNYRSNNRIWSAASFCAVVLTLLLSYTACNYIDRAKADGGSLVDGAGTESWGTVAYRDNQIVLLYPSEKSQTYECERHGAPALCLEEIK